MTGGPDFWSRRRQAVREEAAAQDATIAAEALAQDHAALDAMSEPEILEQLGLPDPDTLQQGDDFAAFMAKAVPDAIRRRALRTLWRSNPVLANVDALVDYGEDFTDSAMAVENIQTAYQVGKGMLKHIEAMARQAAEADTDAIDDEDEDDADDGTVTLADSAEPSEVLPPSPNTEVEADQVSSPSPRRMKFDIEERA